MLSSKGNSRSLYSVIEGLRDLALLEAADQVLLVQVTADEDLAKARGRLSGADSHDPCNKLARSWVGSRQGNRAKVSH